MKILTLPLALLMTMIVLVAHGNDSYRTFTDDQGRTIRAAVVRTAPDEVWIRRDDGQTFRVSRTTFSADDRTYIARWETLNALRAPNALEFAARRYSGGQRHVSETRTRRNSSEHFGYVITLKNNSPVNLENLEIEYRCFVWVANDLAQSGQNRNLHSFGGRVRLDKLGARDAAEIRTDTVPLHSTRLQPNAYNTNTNRRRANDDLRGVSIRVRQDGEVIAEFATTPGLLEEEAPEHSRWRVTSRGR